MGLSNNERFEKIAYSISNILSQSAKLKEGSYLKVLAAQLWPAFLGGKSNSGFWLFGGGFDCSCFPESSLLCTAFKQNMPDSTDEDFYLDKKDFEGTYPDSPKARKTIAGFLKISALISHPEESAVIEINQWVENLVYALRRYDDEFSAALSDLSDLVCKMQGEIFDITRNNPNYYKAWLLCNIIEKCVDLWSDDVVSKWVRHQNIHHDLHLSPDHKLDDLQVVYFDLQPCHTRQIAAEKRLFILLALCGPRYHYDHQFKELKKWVEEHNAEYHEEQIDITRLQQIFEWCKEKKKEGEKSWNSSRYCELSGQKIV